MAAARLHQRLDLASRSKPGGNVDVFGAIHIVELPLILRPLDRQLGAYLSDPEPGVLVTTQRSMSIQRFMAATSSVTFRCGTSQASTTKAYCAAC